jgi:nicotinamide-nucleotide amidase
MDKDDYSLSANVGVELSKAGLQVAVAESCTGGMLGEWLSAVPGSSEYFLGGVISYDNRLKEGLLGIPPDVIREHGAVSTETALAMARGVMALVGAGIAVSVTGVAGPGGGTMAKPTGLTYIALVTGDTERVEQHIWQGDRQANREQSARRALQMILEHLQV